MISLEKEFDTCVKEIGGIKISTIVGSSPPFLNADYLFPEYEVIAELKCLEEDQIKNNSLKKKATTIYERYLNEGTAPETTFGKVQISSEGFPE